MTSKNVQFWRLALGFFLIQSASFAEMKVITSTTDLAWAVKEIGGKNVEVQSFLKGAENPHYVDAVPEFIRLASEAQVAVIVGLDLEIGWIPKVLSRSGNAKIQPGGMGYVEAGKGIVVLEKPVGGVDRSMGDVHPAGNPHFWLSPTTFAKAMVRVTDTLIANDPAHTADYQAGLKKFTQTMQESKTKNERKLKTAFGKNTGPQLVEYHKEFAYFLDTYRLVSFGSIEEKPGVSPSAGRLGEIATSAKAAGIRIALAADTAPKKTLIRFTELSGIPVVQVPMSVQPFGDLKTYPEFQDYIVDSIVKQLGATKS